jgi:IS5 family transposase
MNTRPPEFANPTGVRLVLLTDERGLPLGYTIVPANEKEHEPLADLLTGTAAQLVIADKGPLGSRRPGTARRRRDPAAYPRPETHHRQ